MSPHVFKSASIIITLLVTTILISSANGGDILIINPAPSFSHQQPFRELSRSLLKRGHKVTGIVANPLEEHHENYTFINLKSSYDILNAEKGGKVSLQVRILKGDHFTIHGTFSKETGKAQLSLKEMQDFIRFVKSTKKKYDLVIFECIAFHAYYSLINLVGSPPVIGMVTLPTNYVGWVHGTMEHPGYVPAFFWSFTDKMSLLERVENTIAWIRHYIVFKYTVVPQEQELADKYIDNPGFKIFDSIYNNSLLIVSHNDIITGYPKATLKHIIDVGPLHLRPPNPLDKDLQQILDGSPGGVIYFSLGSNMKSSSMSQRKINSFLNAFRRLPQYHILWKWEKNEKLPGQPDNVFVRKWLPQQDIFPHPKIKLFITQAGLQSLQEAIHNAIPMVCIPMFGDQDFNCNRMKYVQAGYFLDWSQLDDEDAVYEAIKTVLEDPKYAKGMKKLSELSKDTILSPIDTATYWVEYVLRHNGAPHLRSQVQNLSWIQFLLLDVFFVIFIFTVSILFSIYLICRIVVNKCNDYRKKRQ